MTKTTNRDETALMRPAEVARILSVHPRTLQRMADRGDLTAITLPSGHRRYRREDVLRITRGHRAA